MSQSDQNYVVTTLNTYPLKSARGLSSTQMFVDLMGPQWDRRWMVVDSNNRFLTQRQLATMCLISVAVTPQGLSMSAPGKITIDVAFPVDAPQRKVVVWLDQLIVHDCGDIAAAWLTDFLEQDCRLVFMPEGMQRRVDPNYPPLVTSADGLVSFTDGFPLMLTSEASLQSLNKRLDQPISMDRFRPNIVVGGCEAFAEDEWKLLRIGSVEFSVVKPCSRCVIPSIDPATAIKQSEVLKTLVSFRRRDDAIYFGQNLVHHQNGMIKVGDKVEVLA